MVEIRKLPRDDEPTDEVAELKAEVESLKSLVVRVLAAREGAGPSGPSDPPPIESYESERDRILAAWSTEPRVRIFIPADENDKRAAAELVARKLPPAFPPMVFQVNGVQFAVPKNKQTEVPQSIADLYAYMTNPWESQYTLPPVSFDEAEARIGIAV